MAVLNPKKNKIYINFSLAGMVVVEIIEEPRDPLKLQIDKVN